jgi:hypothetical protein
LSNGSDSEPEHEQPWQTVQRRRARSLDSAELASDKRGKRGKNYTLTAEQNQAVESAAQALTAEQHEHISRRTKAVKNQRKKSTDSRGEGPSRNKGKGRDPREWGNINLDEAEMNMELQQAALESYKNLSKPSEKNREGSSWTKKAKGTKKSATQRHKRRERPPESRPVAQIAPDSYLGIALRNLENWEEGPSDGPSSSEPTSDPSDYYEKQIPEGYSRHSHRRHRSQPRSRRSKSTLKPIAPKEYDGTADARAYHRFIRESEAYLRDGKVKNRRRQVFILSHYLTGKAQVFQRVI